MNWAQLNRIQGFRQTYCDNISHYLKLLCHSYFMNLCRVCSRIQLRNVPLPHSMPQSTARYHYNNIGVLISSKFNMWHSNGASLGYRMSQTLYKFVEDWGCNKWFSHATSSVHSPVQEKWKVIIVVTLLSPIFWPMITHRPSSNSHWFRINSLSLYFCTPLDADGLPLAVAPPPKNP